MVVCGCCCESAARCACRSIGSLRAARSLLASCWCLLLRAYDDSVTPQPSHGRARTANDAGCLWSCRGERGCVRRASVGVMPAGGGAAAHGAAGRHPGPCWKGGENIWGAGEGEAPAADDRGASLAASSKHGRRGAPLVKGPGAAAAAARGPSGHQSHSNTIECAPLIRGAVGRASGRPWGGTKARRTAHPAC